MAASTPPGLAVHTAAQRRTEPLLQAVGAGTEAAAFAQNCKLRPVLVHFRLQSDAVRIQADPGFRMPGPTV